MKISQIIEVLQLELDQHGDIPLFVEYNDGKSTYAMPAGVTVARREIWPGHPQGKIWFLTI